MIFASFIIEHNIPIASTEHLGSIFYVTIRGGDALLPKQQIIAALKSVANFIQNGIIDVLKNNLFKLDTFLFFSI